MEIDRTFLDDQAKERFLEMQGQGRKILNWTKRRKNIKILYTQKEYILDGNINKIERKELSLGKETITCELFDKILVKSPEKVIFFLISVKNRKQDAGGLLENSESLLENTAYLDAARWWLEDKVKFENRGKRVSQSFGPGAMRIAAESLPVFYRLADGGQAGVSVNSYGLLEPETSCTFFYFTGGRVMEVDSCMYCSANRNGCMLCINNGKKGH